MRNRYELRGKEVFDQNTNMRALIERLLDKVEMAYPWEQYITIMNEIFSAVNAIMLFYFDAPTVFAGNETDVEQYTKTLQNAKEGIGTVNHYAREVGMDPIVPEPDETLAGLFKVCCEYTYDATDYSIHCGADLDS